MMREGEPALPDRSPSASKGNFKWPCERREAHGPHERRWVGNMDARRLPGYTEEMGKEPRVYVDGQGMMTLQKMCPGVKAHPNTMIGRK